MTEIWRKDLECICSSSKVSEYDDFFMCRKCKHRWDKDVD